MMCAWLLIHIASDRAVTVTAISVVDLPHTLLSDACPGRGDKLGFSLLLRAAGWQVWRLQRMCPKKKQAAMFAFGVGITYPISASGKEHPSLTQELECGCARANG